MKITVITSRFGISGVPLAQLRFARALASRGHTVEYIIGYVNEGNQEPNIDGVKVHTLNKLRVINMILPLVTYFKKEKPNIVFTAGDHLNAIVTLAILITGLDIKISASSRVTPFDTYSNKLFSKRWILKQLMKILMPKIDVLTCVSKDMVKQYEEIFIKTKHTCVYNIIVDKESKKRIIEDIPEKDQYLFQGGSIIIAAGMLEPWKGFSDLILSMSELLKSKKAHLVILGEGSMKLELENLIQSLNLNDNITLLGYVANPLKYFRKADVFVLSSYVEGLPNVLIEAMMCGCTPVSTDCPTGPKEVLQNGKYGYLVPMRNPKALAKGIEEALSKPISKKLLDEAIEPFSEDNVISEHFKLLKINTHE